MTRRAVLWLCGRVQQPILKLEDEHYSENGMSDLLTERGSAYDVNIEMFNATQHTITGWPGGKPQADDTHRPERAKPFPKRSLILSPEPMDDVASMGGTMHRLANQGNHITVAYQTSGNLAVPDDEVRRALELMNDLGSEPESASPDGFARKVIAQLDAKGRFGEDTADIRQIKGLIRRSEARSSARLLAIDVAALRFLDLDFYEKGRYRRFQHGSSDVSAMLKLLEEVKPHQIFATGSGHDPLSVPAICFQVLVEALQECRRAKAGWLQDCRIWLYRGPGAEWEPGEIDMAVPLSPGELDNKIQGIYQHQSQRSQSPDSRRGNVRNSWNLANEISRATARAYDKFGMAEYEALECFKHWPLTESTT